MKYLRKFKELILIRTWLIGEGKLSRLIAARVLKSHCIYFENLWVIMNEVFLTEKLTFMIPTSVVFIIRIPSVKTEMACVSFATFKR